MMRIRVQIPEFAQKVFQSDSPVLRSHIGDYQEAMQMFADEIRLNPVDRDLRVAYAACLRELERNSEALHQLSLVQDMHGDITEEGKSLTRQLLFDLRLDVKQKEITMFSGIDTRKLATRLHEKARRFFTFGIRKMAISSCIHLTQMVSDDTRVTETPG